MQNKHGRDDKHAQKYCQHYAFDPKDGSIHISEEQLHTLKLEHYCSGIYRDEATVMHPKSPENQGINIVKGYTEWLVRCNHTISVSWDWQLNLDSPYFLLKRINAPFTNLRIFRRGVEDFDYQTLSAFIDRLAWQADCRQFIINQKVPSLSRFTASSAP